MPKLEGSAKCWVIDPRTGERKRYLVQYMFTNYEQMKQAAIRSEQVKFQAAMRGTIQMPASVSSFVEIKEDE